MPVFLSGLVKPKPVEDDRDKFELTGPRHLLKPQWSNPAEKRAAIGCLTQSVYVMEKDRQLGYLGTGKEMAPVWRSCFNYKLLRPIYCKESDEQVISGAIFKWSRSMAFFRPADAPKFIVAFRGTMNCGDAMLIDWHDNLSLLLQKLHTSKRLVRALEDVKDTLKLANATKICIAGHSLGAALCLIVGANLFKDGINIDTHAFNPPFPSLRLKVPENSTFRAALHTVHMVAVSAVASIVQDEKSQVEAFSALKEWRPHIYVNSHDPVCLSYIGYFLDRSAMPNSLQSLISSLFGEKFKPYHLIPSAHLYIIDDKSLENFAQAHGMHQWWSPTLQVICHEMIFDLENRSDAHNASF